MSYRSEVAAVIGGKPEKIRQFAKIVLEKNIEDSFKILEDFRILELESDLSIFCFYNDYCKWYPEAEETWRILRELADQLQLSYLFYRVGASYGDVEVDNNSEANHFDSRVEELFSYHCCIDVNHPRLCEILRA